jgi:hypothetical protein
VEIAHADQYAETLARDGAVIASFAERKAEIARQLAAAAARLGGGARPIEDDALLDEVTALVERPNVLVCEFEEQFLGVPQECLILTMKANQKYFPLLDAAGKLTNKFLVVSNISPEDTELRHRRQRARGAPASGRRQVLLRPGPQKDIGLARGQAWPRWFTTTNWARRASAWSACAPSPRPLPSSWAMRSWCRTPTRPRCWPRPTS